MPEMTFTVEWPDGSIQDCYSPSLVMHDHLKTGESYSVEDFVNRVSTALDEASTRVREKYGFVCTSAMAQRDEVRERARSFNQPIHALEQAGVAGSKVRVVAMKPQLPAISTEPKESSIK